MTWVGVVLFALIYIAVIAATCIGTIAWICWSLSIGTWWRATWVLWTWLISALNIVIRSVLGHEWLWLALGAAAFGALAAELSRRAQFHQTEFEESA